MVIKRDWRRRENESTSMKLLGCAKSSFLTVLANLWKSKIKYANEEEKH